MIATSQYKSCTYNATPEYKNISNVSISDVSLNSVGINSKANFYNPNDIGLILKNVELSVFLNGQPIGSINQTASTAIGAKKEFGIPLRIQLSQSQLFNAIGGLSGGLSAAFGKSVKIGYRGKITVSKFWIPFTFNFSQETDMKL